MYNNARTENELRNFISDFELKVKPVMKEATLASWNASLRHPPIPKS